MTCGSFSLTYSIDDEVDLILSCDDDFSCMIQLLEYFDSKFIYISMKKSVDGDIVCCSKGKAVVSIESCLVSGEVNGEVASEVYRGMGSTSSTGEKVLLYESWKYFIKNESKKFGDVKKFRIKLVMYAVELGFMYVLVKNDRTRVTAECSEKWGKGCECRVHASF